MSYEDWSSVDLVVYTFFTMKLEVQGSSETLASIYKDADKSLARPGRKQATSTEDFDFRIPYL